MTDNNAKGISTVDAAGIRTYSMLINGQWSQAADGGLLDSVNPATGAVWSRVPEATAEMLTAPSGRHMQRFTTVHGAG